LMIGSDAMGDIPSGGGKTFEVYFKFDTYPGQDVESVHMTTPLVDWGVPISIFLIFVAIGLFLLCFGIMLFVFYQRKSFKEYGKVLMGVGLLVVVITWVLSALGV